MAVSVKRGALSDERLVELACAGDEQAFAAIVERYRAPLLRYCQGFVSGAAAADDAVQQTFINAFGVLSPRGRGRAPAALRPWLYRVAHNAALNVARDPQAGLDELPEGLDGVARPDEVFQARERFERVVGAVGALPPRQRQVIVRHALDGDSHERIATDLGVSPGSVRQLMHRARRTLREAAAAVIPAPLLRWLPFGADAVEAVPAAGGGAVLAKVAVAVVVAGAAGGGAVEVSKRDPAKPAVAKAAARPAPRAPEATRSGAVRSVVLPPAPIRQASVGGVDDHRRSSSGHGSSGSGSSGSSGSDSSGASGSGSSGSSGAGSSGSSGSSGSGSSGSGSSGSSGPGPSDTSGSGSGSSGSGSSGSSGPGPSSTSGSVSSGSSGPGPSSSSDLSTPSGSSGPGPSASPTPEPSPSGSGTSGSSGSGKSGSDGLDG